jgi:hypothetical protein
MSEQTKPYFSLYVNLDNCKDVLERFDLLDKYRHRIHATFGGDINCFVFPTEGESRVECVSPVSGMDEIVDKLNKILESK